MMSSSMFHKNTLKASFSIFKIKVAEGLQYRLAALAGAFTSIFWVLIEITVYIIFFTYSNNRNASFEAGITIKQIISYAWLTQFFFLMQPMSIDSEILNKITSGDVGIEMCRPLDLYSHWFARTAATRLTPLFLRGTFTILVGILIPGLYGLSAPASILGCALMIISFLGAFFLCTAYGMLINAIRLNITLGEGPTYILMLIGGVLSGAYLPLQLWPKFLQGILVYQPFAGYLDIPLRFYIGTVPPDRAFFYLGIQLIWIIFFIVLGRTIMSKRLKNIVVQGG